MGLLDRAKSDSHSRRSHIRNVSESDKIGPAVIDADAHLRSPSERRGRLHKTAKDTQIAGDTENLLFRLNIHDFGLGRKGPPHRAMLFHPHNQSMEPLCEVALSI